MPRAARLSCVCSARVRLCSHHHHLPADTEFPILSQQREWKEGKRLRPEGGGQGRSWLLCPGSSFQPRSGARPPAARAARGRNRTAPGRRQQEQRGRGAWVLSSHLARGSPSGSLPQELRLPGGGALGSRGVLEPGPVPTAAFLPPRESVLGAPLTVHFRPPGAQPGIPLPRPRHVEGRGSRDEGAWDPSPPVDSSSTAEEAGSSS